MSWKSAVLVRDCTDIGTVSVRVSAVIEAVMNWPPISPRRRPGSSRHKKAGSPLLLLLSKKRSTRRLARLVTVARAMFRWSIAMATYCPWKCPLWKTSASSGRTIGLSLEEFNSSCNVAPIRSSSSITGPRICGVHRME
ncbi:hypothetical protein SALBM135S_07426 [Streptomyces alboniger]